ncbi:MAG: stage III sporulation protein AG [Lachnospiraceae bacterium]|nr:stage III sporulation protein AG [Lachnospiraceae bacterium]
MMEKWKELCGKIGKDRFLILIIGGLLLLVITYPLPSGSDGKSRQNGTGKNTVSQKSETAVSESGQEIKGLNDYGAKTEARLAEILSNVSGAGKVKVFISFGDYGTNVVEKDVSYTRSNEDRSGTDIQNTSTVNTENTETTIYTSDENGNDVPFVRKIMTPKVEGVFVVAEGGENQKVRDEMKEAIMALFGIEEHKIKVVKMKGEER